MLFTKPKNLKYTDLCIWIDANAYKSDCDDEKLYEYLYIIVHMLAVKGGYGKSPEEFDEFSMRAANRLYFRLRSDRQYVPNAKGQTIPKVKSILNYAKHVIGPLYIDFKKENSDYIQVDDVPYIDTDLSFGYWIDETVDNLTRIEFESCLKSIDKIIKKHLSKIPRKTNCAEWDNIYLSCLLSFLNLITFSKKIKKRLQAIKDRVYNVPEILQKIYYKQNQECVVLFHLPDEMNLYIKILVNQLKHIIAQELGEDLHTYLPTQATIENLMSSTITSEDDD